MWVWIFFFPHPFLPWSSWRKACTSLRILWSRTLAPDTSNPGNQKKNPCYLHQTEHPFTTKHPTPETSNPRYSTLNSVLSIPQEPTKQARKFAKEVYIDEHHHNVSLVQPLDLSFSQLTSLFLSQITCFFFVRNTSSQAVMVYISLDSSQAGHEGTQQDIRRAFPNQIWLWSRHLQAFERLSFFSPPKHQFEFKYQADAWSKATPPAGRVITLFPTLNPRPRHDDWWQTWNWYRPTNQISLGFPGTVHRKERQQAPEMLWLPTPKRCGSSQ